MKTYEFKPISIGDISAMASLLLSRQSFESNVFPFLENSCFNTKYITDSLQKLFFNMEWSYE